MMRFASGTTRVARADGLDAEAPPDGALPLDALADAALSLASRRGGIILCFHQIAPERFVRWMEALASHFRVVCLDELLHRHERRQSLARLLAVTFDDGWARTCEPVAEICKRRQWPITIYAVSSVVASGGTLWFAELPTLLRDAAGRRVAMDGHELNLTSRRAASTTADALVRWLSTLPGEDAVRAIEVLRAKAGRPRTASPAPFIDAAFMRRHADSAWIRFGSHTVDHQSLAAQDDDAVLRQLTESKGILEEIAGRPIAHFCYPYGNPDAIGTRAPSIAASLYRSATTMVRGVCDAHRRACYLPRIPLYDSDTDRRMLAKVALAAWV